MESPVYSWQHDPMCVTLYIHLPTYLCVYTHTHTRRDLKELMLRVLTSDSEICGDFKLLKIIVLLDIYIMPRYLFFFTKLKLFKNYLKISTKIQPSSFLSEGTKVVSVF